MIDKQKNDIKENMQLLRREMDDKDYDFVEIKYRKHFDTPQFWVIKIDNDDIFWGYFTLTGEDDVKCFEGSLNNCFHFKNGNSELDGFSDWVDNIFDRLDDWAKKG
jgi:hypothetical protein